MGPFRGLIPGAAVSVPGRTVDKDLGSRRYGGGETIISDVPA
jgi:hypothetical protein